MSSVVVRCLQALSVLLLTACSAGSDPSALAAATEPAVAPGEQAPPLALPSIFGDHMVLQQRDPAPLWGWTAPGQEVTVAVTWSDVLLRTRSGEDGRFELALQTPAAGGPHRVTVAAGASRRTFEDVLVGEVWLLGGQSNMEQTLGTGTHAGYGTADAEAVLAGMDRPTLRYYDAAHAVAVDPARDVQGGWVVASPETARHFSATGTFFALDLLAELDVPVGLVGCNWGGTRAEAWTSAAGLQGLPRFADDLARLDELRDDPEGPAAALLRDRARWWSALDAADPGSGQPLAPWAAPDLDTSAWRTVDQPGPWEQRGLEGFDGVAWQRRAVEVPADWAGQDLTLHLGPIDDMDTVYWDGRRVAGSEGPGVWNQARRYTIPGALVRAGPATLAVRVVDTGGAGGLAGAAEDSRLQRGDGVLPLAGPWQLRRGVALAALEAFPAEGWFNRHTPTALSNGMLAPLVPYGLRGVLWYQGESNRYDPATYVELFPALIRDWRARWGRELPFFWVQIAPFAYGGDTGQAAAVRDAQRRALSLPGTGMAVTMDVGDPTNIHPAAKRPVGRRLARWALTSVYGREQLVPSGPLFREAHAEGARLRVHFDHGEGLTFGAGGPSHLEVAGDDGVFQPAQAAVDGSTLLVWSDAVPAPRAVRYAWGAADEPTLANGAGLPAASFRSDAWW